MAIFNSNLLNDQRVSNVCSRLILFEGLDPSLLSDRKRHGGDNNMKTLRAVCGDRPRQDPARICDQICQQSCARDLGASNPTNNRDIMGDHVI